MVGRGTIYGHRYGTRWPRSFSICTHDLRDTMSAWWESWPNFLSEEHWWKWYLQVQTRIGSESLTIIAHVPWCHSEICNMSDTKERERERGKKHLSSSTSIITSNFMSHRWKRFYAVSLPRGCHPEVYHELGRMWAENLSGFRETTHQSFETDEEATELPEALHELGWMWAANLPGFRETTHQSFETDEEATELLVVISLGTEL